MGDQSTPATPENAGGLLRGPDGKLSGRKLQGWIGFIVGLALLVVGQFRGGSLVERIAAGGVALVYALLMSGLLTAQNLREIAAAAKGAAP